MADTTSPATLTADPATLAAVSTVATTTPQPVRSKAAGKSRTAADKPERGKPERDRTRRGMVFDLRKGDAAPLCPGRAMARL
ncbi:hypothetical protein Sp245p_32470 (plasmid) [Azospirillum baldaniorum]|uniref:Uncharacterized protein n=1 Tax=Azospirillum baldaniorum TaxID=1064539 RepID=A0A9P1K181_9PROT|nr:hypothetical protein Sp245p_32470 [Azospirillum baldaniorum]CCD03628.1 protein of unknown function [Azospirillum baldaniorum]